MTIPTRTERQQWKREAQAVEANPHLYELDSTLTSARRILALLDALTAVEDDAKVMTRDLKWAALRRWHRDERKRWLGQAARSDVHDAALTEMTRLSRLTRAASRKGKQ